ncbi:sodium pump decarboxylase subunit gamma [Pistricoccus aurantiacus]|uniref:Probable oxaloacetate decarboxylase gamma chain n=1 Tax=Pistricoccus aurantiacus TaxID=1883414 RepID=A0A5B8SP11_9GAMM|nr:OadG family protein [Pistricoccus aurantiacus]QEA37934.1 sodium pump decarboxylase subunit gamma [Pistricoccus aurantiacus]
MQNSSLLQEGLMLMAFGMGFVFIFLTILVVATSLMSRVVKRLVPVPAKPGPSTGQKGKAEDDDAVLAAIGVAIHRYRRRGSDVSSS